MAVKIHELRAKRADIKAKMVALQAKDTADESMSAEDAAEFNGLGDQLADHDQRIARCEQLLSDDAEDAKSVDSDDQDDVADTKNFRPSNLMPMRVYAEAKPVEAKDGSKAIQMMVAKAYDRLDRKADDRFKNGREMIKAVYGRGEESEVTKALAATGTGPNGGFLIPTSYLAELIQFLRSKVVMRRLPGVQHLELPTGNLTIPRQSGTSTANWTYENQDIPTSVLTFDDIVLSAHKLTAMVPCSNDLIRRSPISAETVIRNDMAAQISRAEDIAFLRGDGTGGKPTGLLGFALPSNIHTYTGALTDSQAILSFLSAIVSSVEVQNVDLSSGAWIMPPAVKNFLVAVRNGLGYPFFPELSGMTLLGYPVLTTTQLPNNLTNSGGTAGSEIYFVASDQFIIADALAPTIEVSREASYMDVGTNTLVSAWSRDQTVMRCIEEVDCSIYHPQAVAVGLINAWVPAG